MQTVSTNMDNGALPTCGIAVMAKASIAGRTKTRLVPPLTFEEAARCNTAFLLDIADNILAAAAQASIAGYIAFGPPHSRPLTGPHLGCLGIRSCHAFPGDGHFCDACGSLPNGSLLDEAPSRRSP